jgi:hypothetical protein
LISAHEALTGNVWHYLAIGVPGRLAKDCAKGLALVLPRLPKLLHGIAEWGFWQERRRSLVPASWGHIFFSVKQKSLGPGAMDFTEL